MGGRQFVKLKKIIDNQQFLIVNFARLMSESL